jgi:hypothetical protein
MEEHLGSVERTYYLVLQEQGAFVQGPFAPVQVSPGEAAITIMLGIHGLATAVTEVHMVYPGFRPSANAKTSPDFRRVLPVNDQRIVGCG